MSNTLANHQMDERIANEPERDGVTIHLDHDEVCRLHAILGETDVGAMDDAYKTLGQYLDKNGGHDTYYVDLGDFIKLRER